MSYIWFGVLAGVLAFTLPLTRNKSWFGSRKLLRGAIIGGEVVVVIAFILFWGGTDCINRFIGSVKTVYAQDADLNFTCGVPRSQDTDSR